tara:strand:+ start:936 stop:1508 length:573 start_codon:yes stop_codon:yes gene_type:complete
MWMSEVQEAITSRRTIYRYSTREVDSRFLEMGFEAARNAPCHKNTHPWRFYVMGEDSRNTLIPEIKRLAVKKYVGEDDSDEIVTRAINKILSPPVLICVTTSLSPEDSFREEEDYAATVCATHNLILSLWGNGIGSQWSTGSITRSDLAYSAIGAMKDKERIIGFIKIGYPDEIPSKSKKGIEEIRTYLP